MITFWLLSIFWFHHKSQKPPVAQPHVTITIDYMPELIADLTDLEEDEENYPWLKNWIDPAKSLTEKLLTETSNDPGFNDDLDLLDSDLSLIRRMKLNDTI